MKHLKSYALLYVIVLSSAVFIFGFTNEPNRISVDGFSYETFGEARISNTSDGIRFAELGAPGSGISVIVPNLSTGGFEFAPVDLEEGSSFFFSSVDHEERSLLAIELHQTGPTTTDVWLKLDMIDGISGQEVVLFARDRAGIGREVSVPTKERIHIGTVFATSSAWAQSWAWVCDDGQCSWVLDPDGTSIELAAMPGSSIPFHEIGVRMNIKSGVDIRVGRVEMYSLVK